MAAFARCASAGPRMNADALRELPELWRFRANTLYRNEEIATVLRMCAEELEVALGLVPPQPEAADKPQS